MAQISRGYGDWVSPLTGETFSTRSVRFSQVRISGVHTFWVEDHPKDNGRSVLLRRDALGQTQEILPMIDGIRLPDVRTRVYEYGGRAYAVLGSILVFSDGFDDRLYAYDLGSPTKPLVPLTPMGHVRYGDFEIDEVRALVYAVSEDHSIEGEPVNSLVAVPLDGSAARDISRIRTIFSGTDFCSAPTLSPDGSKLAFLTWNHPDTPWTHSALHVASLTFEGQIEHDITLVDKPDVCVYEPRWTLRGDLIHVDDSTGWANLYRTEGFEWQEGDNDDSAWTSRLRTRDLHPGAQAFSHPHWLLGLHSYDNLDDEYLICSWSEGHVWHLGTVRLDNGLLEEWPIGWLPVGNVASDQGRVVILADSPTEVASIVEISGGDTKVLRPSTEMNMDPSMISVAQMVTWKTSDDEEAYGFYYPPTNPSCIAPQGELPPLIVNAHPGPTSSARQGLNTRIQYLTTRGFAVLDVNYRGSTGSGREYRERLSGHWGVIDVTDCADGARHLVEQGIVDPQRIAIRGQFAGGFTALNALIHTSVFSAATSVSGITDLPTMVRNAPKFDSHYYFRLIGSNDLTDDVWSERSPLEHAQDIHNPLLLLQGLQDTIIPPSQARSIYEAVRNNGVPVALVEFEHGGHTLIRAEDIRQAWEVELSFYSRVWNLHTEGTIDIEIDNLPL